MPAPTRHLRLEELESRTLLNAGFTSDNTAPDLAPLADQTVAADQQTVDLTLWATDAENDPITYSASGQSLAYLITQQENAGAWAYKNAYDNWAGHNEKWFAAGNGQWYYILPNAEVYRWSGSGLAGTLLGNVGISYYHDTNRLTNPPADDPHAAISVEGDQLTLTRDLNWVSTIVVTATADDGNGGTDSETFVIKPSTNHTPDLAPIENRTIPEWQQTLDVALSATDPDNDPITYSATGQSLAYLITQQENAGTWIYKNAFDNWAGQNDRWFQADNQQWYFILPSGEVYRWSGSGLSGTLLGNVGTSYHTNPHNLTNPPADEPHATFSFSGNELTVTRDPGWVSSMVVTVTAHDGNGGTDSETFFVTSSVNHAPDLAPIADQTIPASQQSLTVPLDATDPDNNPISYTVSAQSLAYLITQQENAGTWTYKNAFDNWGGQNEKWLLAGNGQYYYILQNGEVYRWSGSGLSGTFLGNVGASYYYNPLLLSNPPANDPHASFSFSGNQLTITRDPYWMSTIVITVTASDGNGGIDSEAFSVYVTG